MDSKKRANGTAAADSSGDDRNVKRRKIAEIDLSNGETRETTTEFGLEFLEHIKRTQDKSKRLVAKAFLTLPSRKDHPDYYRVTRMPIAIDTIEKKLHERYFENLSALEGYFKRMIANAKEYNTKGSDIYEDAERMRKALSNFMVKHNPAYQDKSYQAVATPIPDNYRHPTPAEEEDAEGEPEDIEEMVSSKRKRSASVAQPQSSQSYSNQEYTARGFEGLTFQQAQEKIVADLMTYKYDENDEGVAFEVFVTLPSRTLKEYYEIIKNPMSLTSFQKRVKGQHGQSRATGISEFKNWKDFEETISTIWVNAQYFNEDGSEIFNLAGEFKEFFEERLKEAKRHVVEPSGTTKITLKTKSGGGHKITIPIPRSGAVSNGNSAAASPALAPQSKHAQANSRNSSTPNPRSALSGSASSPTPTNGAIVKGEASVRPSPMPPAPLSAGFTGGAYANGSAMLPPVYSTPKPVVQAPYPVPSPYVYGPSQQLVPNPLFEDRFRKEGKTAADALVSNVSIATHPGLNIPHHFKMDLPPDDEKRLNSVTFNLPSSTYYLQIKPTIPAHVLQREHKIFVLCRNERLQQMPLIPGHPVNNGQPLYEARLYPGVNEIRIEVIAALPKGDPIPANPNEAAEFERITIFANLMRTS